MIKKQQKQKGNRALIMLVVAMCLVGTLLASTLTARYIAGNKRQAEMYASDFHVSSNYLKAEKGAAYTVTDGDAKGIEILLYNYETENTALIAEEDIVYQVSMDRSNWELTVKRQNGTNVQKNDQGYYILAGNGVDQESHVIHLKYTGTGTPQSVEVTVETKSPFVKKLSAIFTVVGEAVPEYHVEDKGTYCLLTIQSNDYEGAMTVNWDSACFSPDNTNVHMSSWSDLDSSGSLNVESYHTYELIFVKKQVGSIREQSGRGAVILLNFKKAGE